MVGVAVVRITSEEKLNLVWHIVCQDVEVRQCIYHSEEKRNIGWHLVCRYVEASMLMFMYCIELLKCWNSPNTPSVSTSYCYIKNKNSVVSGRKGKKEHVI